MSEKRKPKVIHVDKLVVNADEVVIVDNVRRERPRPNPWGFRPIPGRYPARRSEWNEEVTEEAEQDEV